MSRSITEDDILVWLKDNPDFLKDNPQVLHNMTPPQESQGRGVADFQSYMIKRLQSEKTDAVKQTHKIVETSRANMDNQERINRAVLMLLEARNLEGFIDVITMDLATLLGVDVCTLVIEPVGDVIPHINRAGIRAVQPGTIHTLMDGKDARLMSNVQSNIKTPPAVQESLYGGSAPLVKSQALLRLSISEEAPLAILTFGSRNPNLFEEGQGTDHIGFLARVIERCFHYWLYLPAARDVYESYL